MKLNSQELVLLTRLYLAEHSPYVFIIKKDAEDLLGINKNTMTRIAKTLERKKLIKIVWSVETYYYPLRNNNEIKQRLLKIYNMPEEWLEWERMRVKLRENKQGILEN